jgi:predicted enzyme related to lactoylglutathione lyase
MSGRVVHFEIPADDVDRASRFYTEAFGWQLTPTPGYTLVATTKTGPDGVPIEPGINGGMLARQAPVIAPVITIDVDDMDEALGKLERLGGRTVQGKLPVGEMGFSAYFEDTEGNVIGLFQAARPA